MKYCNFSLFLAAVVLGSCISFSFDSKENSSWAAMEKENSGRGWQGTVRIVSVSAEKSGEWGSVSPFLLEKEMGDLLPLLFSEEAYLVVSPAAEADFYAEVKVREREYPDRWQTKRSLSAEVRLWSDAAEGSVSQPLPLSAGRALLNGKQSLASSKTLSSMLRKAVKSALQGLPPAKTDALQKHGG